jgi:glucose/arabinose dehydrogenase
MNANNQQRDRMDYNNTNGTTRLLARLGPFCGLALIAFGCTSGAETGGKANPAPAPATGGAGAPPNDVPVRHAPPRRVIYRASDLPAPFATPSAENHPRVSPRPADAALTLPPGFHIHLWAEGLENPRIITIAPNGDAFVAESGRDRVRVLRDADGDGKAETREVFAAGLRQPFGIGFYPPGPNPQFVYVANTDSVVRFPYKNGDLKATGPAQTIINDLPGRGYRQHWTRNLRFRPDGSKLYVSVGSETNVGEEPEKRAAILEYNPDGSGYRVYASGIRNTVGLAFNPIDNSLWTAVNERDGLGDDLVPDYATSVKSGGFYGWPWYYIGPNKDPRMRDRPDLKDKTLVPDVLFQSHTAALGMEFYTADKFPVTYRNSAFVALHGSWNRSQRSGYSVVRIPFGSNGKPEGGYEEFVTGWALPDGTVWGRPVDVAVARDGALLITDDGAGKIWRVIYTGQP